MVMITVMMCTQSFMVLPEKSLLWVVLLYVWMSDVICFVFLLWERLELSLMYREGQRVSDVPGHQSLEFLC